MLVLHVLTKVGRTDEAVRLGIGAQVFVASHLLGWGLRDEDYCWLDKLREF